MASTVRSLGATLPVADILPTWATETWIAVASAVFAALSALAAVLSAKATFKSANAQERTADIAAQALELDHQRRIDEEFEKASANAPRFRVARVGTSQYCALHKEEAGKFEFSIENKDGKSQGIIERIRVEFPSGDIVDKPVSADSVRLGPGGESRPVPIDVPQGAMLDGNGVVDVVLSYAAVSGPFRAVCRQRLARDNARHGIPAYRDLPEAESHTLAPPL